MTALRLGCDVGGTNTDAALLAGDSVLATAKAPTTPDDIAAGLVHAVRRLLLEPGVSPGVLRRVAAVMVGTTQLVNALVQRQHLARVLVVRLCGPATRALPPFIGLPAGLLAAVYGGHLFASGGFEFDGVTELSPLRPDDAAEAAQLVLQHGAAAVVVCGVHSPVQPSQELEFAAWLRDQLAQRAPGRVIHITLSHKLSGRLGLLEREAAAILNAALQPFAASVVLPAYSRALHELGLGGVPLFLTGNDGTLLTAGAAEECPVHTFRSGPVNSVRGAAWLAGLSDALVLDIGGTTSDCGAVVRGMPRPSGVFVDLCGVPTNFQMPDVASVGLGGGSIVTLQFSQGQECPGPPQPQCAVGPTSVGSALPRSCLVCGGATLTASDVAVLLHDRLPGLASRERGWQAVSAAAASGSSPGPPRPSHEQLAAAWRAIQQQLAAAVDRTKQSAAPVPLIVVGGGAPLCDDNLPGCGPIIRPRHGDCANAIGAAIPQVRGVFSSLVNLTPATRQQQLAAAVQQATAAAIAAGADAATCRVVECEEVPVAYGPAGCTRLYVKAVGDLGLQPAVEALPRAPPALQPLQPLPAAAGEPSMPAGGEAGPVAEQLQLPPPPPAAGRPAAVLAALAAAAPASYSLQQLLEHVPRINAQGLWEVDDLDLDCMAVGAQLLGCGGGGSARHHVMKLKHAMALERGGGSGGSSGSSGSGGSGGSRGSRGSGGSGCGGRRPLVLCLDDLPDDAHVCSVGGMGAPSVASEKLDSHEAAAAVRALRGVLPIDALLCAEVGGGNCLEPLAVGLALDLPVVDCDLMGRAFPELQQTTAALAGVPLTPAAIADTGGRNVLLMMHAASALAAERVLRAACTEMGCSVGLADSPMSGAQAKQVAIPGSLSLAWHIGVAVLRARAAKADPVAAVLQLFQGQGRLLFTGKVVDVQRTTEGGFVRGRLRIRGRAPQLAQPQPQPLPAAPGQQEQLLEVRFQNENLIAEGSAEGSSSCVLGCVPDLVCVVETATAAAVATEDARYGLHVSVLLLPAHPLLRSAEALRVLGPAAFGEPHVVHRPVGDWPQLQSVFSLAAARAAE